MIGQPLFLPMSRPEMERLGWRELDILLVSGDAYVDHPSFGIALLGRLLVSRGYRVGVVAQPRWEVLEQAVSDLSIMGAPRLFAGVSAGSVDSMLAHYTAFRKKRTEDAYTPGGKAGRRPNRAILVYSGLLRRTFPGIPVVLGGIEASLRRASHYDFWSDSLRRSILLDSKADLLVNGMGEKALTGIAAAARKLAEAPNPSGSVYPDRRSLVLACADLPGLVLVPPSPPERAEFLPSHEQILTQPSLLMESTRIMERQIHQNEIRLAQSSGERWVQMNPPAPALTEAELDALYGLPFTRMPHPAYKEPIPAWEMIRTSITTHRGCGGGCSFCSLALHQGRRIASRSAASIRDEALRISAGPWPGKERPPRWASSISDVGGPSANMWRARCTLPAGTACERYSCLHPSPCALFSVDQSEAIRLLRGIADLDGIRHVRVASGIRYDLALQDRRALQAYVAEFTGGQLKIAPEHSEEEILNLMRKPPVGVFTDFLEEFSRSSTSGGKELYTIPYLISAFPGCTVEHMRRLGDWLKKRNWKPQQVQCFIPTPGTIATAMFYAGIDTEGRRLHIARSDNERLRQHHILLGNEKRPGDSKKDVPAARRTNSDRQPPRQGKPRKGRAN